MSDGKTFLELKREECRHAMERGRIAEDVSFYKDRKSEPKKPNKPAKPETALELLSKVVGYLDEPISSQLAHTLAKLRKLLEEQK